jgi:hypothetical protein
MAHDKLRGLKCFDELHDKVTAGISIEEIARWVHEEKQEYRDASRGAVERAIYRYKASLPVTELADGGAPAYLYRRIAHVDRGIDEMDELEKLYHLQCQRIERYMELEGRIPTPLSELRKEISLARDLLVRRLELAMKLGLRKKAPTEFNGTLSLNGEVAHVPALAQMNPQQRLRSGIVAQTLLEAIRGVYPEATELGEAELVSSTPLLSLGRGLGEGESLPLSGPSGLEPEA